MADLNVNPYYDDYDENKYYYQVLFKPGVALQARELTTLQSMLQKQIERHGNFGFKDGASVVGCVLDINNRANFVKLQDIDNGGLTVNVNSFSNTTVQGATSGIKAEVVKVLTGTELATDGPKTLYVRYIDSGTSNTSTTFSDGEAINVVGNNSINAVALSSSATGLGVYAKWSAGYTYAKGKFILNPGQDLIVERYSQSFSKRIGFTVDETFTTSATDNTLLDNSLGSPNENAPGADRLRIFPTLTAVNLSGNTAGDTPNTNNFIEIAQSDAGNIVIKQGFDEPIKYVNRAELAERTYEESGDYVVRPFNLQIEEHANTGSNGGRFANTDGGNTSLLSVSIDGGIAYIKGYRYESPAESFVTVEKGNDTKDYESISVTSNFGNFVYVNEIAGYPTFSNGVIGTQVSLRSAAQDAVTGGTYSYDTAGGSEVGTALVRGMEYHSGTPGTSTAQYKLYLYKVEMTGSNQFKDVRGIHANNFNGTLDFNADPVLVSNNAVLNETGFKSSVYKLPVNAVRTIRDSGGGIDTSYETIENLTGTVAGSSATFSLSVSDQVYEFGAGALSDSQKDEILLVGLANSGIITAGEYFNTEGTNVAITQTTTTQLDLDFSGGSYSGYSGDVLIQVPVQQNNARESRKLLRNNRFVQIDCTDSPYNSANTEFYLGFSDVYKINAIYASRDTEADATASDLNVTDQFELIDGQFDAYYGHSSIKIKSSSVYTATTLGRLLVDLDYFYHDHTQGKGYFSVDSYPIDDTGANTETIFTYNIPVFNSPTGHEFDLRNCIDFRPSYTNTATDATTAGGAATNPAINNTLNFQASGKNYLNRPLGEWTGDLSVYLGRYDRLFLDRSGKFNVVPGTSFEGSTTLSQIPKSDIPPDVMEVADIIVPPYPSIGQTVAKQIKRTKSAAKLRKKTNKRYSMKDIGVLEKRISNLEYYTSLTLLETLASTTSLTNASTGLERFKNGIIVDPFTGHGIGRPEHVDYSIAVDQTTRELRPKYVPFNVDFVFNSSSSTNIVTGSHDAYVVVTTTSSTEPAVGSTLTGGTSSNTARYKYAYQTDSQSGTTYTIYVENMKNTSGNYSGFDVGETITTGTFSATVVSTTRVNTNTKLAHLPYEHAEMVHNPYASVDLEISDTTGLSFVGFVDLTPDTDTWTDVTTNPDAIVNVDSNYDQFVLMADSLGTIWGDWEINWTGVESEDLFQVGDTRTYEQKGDKVGSTQYYDYFEEQDKVGIDLTSTEYSRTGFNINVSASEEKYSLGNKIVDSNISYYMRAKKIAFTASGLKPNTRIHAFFNEIIQDDNIQPTGGSKGAALFSDSNGKASGHFYLPGGTFRVGSKVFKLSNRSDGNINLSQTVAYATFNSYGLQNVEENTIISTKRPIVTTTDVAPELKVQSVISDVFVRTDQVVSENYRSYTPPPPACRRGCFLPGTLVAMEDGTYKAIEKIELGDRVLEGGGVFATGKFLINDLHEYKGIHVAGSHMVKDEDGLWKRVRDCEKSVAIDSDTSIIVHVFGCENRKIIINGIEFADYFETQEVEVVEEIGDEYFKNWEQYADEFEKENELQLKKLQ